MLWHNPMLTVWLVICVLTVIISYIMLKKWY